MSEATAAKTAEVPAEKRKNVQVATTISAAQYDGMVDRKWSSRIEVRDQVQEALEDYFIKHGVKVDGSAPQVDPKAK